MKLYHKDGSECRDYRKTKNGFWCRHRGEKVLNERAAYGKQSGSTKEQKGIEKMTNIPITIQDTQKLHIDSIVPDPKFNSRKVLWASKAGEDGMGEREEFKYSIAKNGILTPLLVTPIDGKPGKFMLVSGYRRYDIAKELEMQELPCLIKEFGKPDGDQKEKRKAASIANRAENFARKNLLPWEQVDALAELQRDFEMKGTDIARNCGLSVSHVNNCLRIANDVDARILQDWRKGAGLTFKHLLDLASMPRQEQWESYQAMGESKDVAKLEEAVAAKKGKEPRKARPSGAKIEEALKAVRRMKAGPERDAIVLSLRWVLGQTPRIGKWYDPDAAAEAKNGKSVKPAKGQSAQERAEA